MTDTLADIWGDIEADVKTEWDKLEGSSIATAIENVYHATITELEAIAPAALETATTTVATSALAAISGGTRAAIAAAIAAAPAAFEAAGHAITEATTQTLATAVVTQINTAQAAAAPPPAA